ncbi:MAG: 50S ribosomal protein L10 [Pyrinomonadaceae bacterium]
MKSRETKQKDLTALTEKLQGSKSAMVVSFSKATVNKDQEFRNRLREAGAQYQVVKNTLARIAVKGTDFEQASEHFKGVTALAWTDGDPVVLSKAISKFMKENTDVYTFKAGVVDGTLVDLKQLTTIANLPSKEELISKLLFVINAQAQRIVTVINAVPRDLAVVIKQIGDKAPATAAPAAKAETPAEVKVEEAAPAVEVEATSTPEAAVEVPAIEAAPEAAPAVEENILEVPAVDGAPAEGEEKAE